MQHLAAINRLLGQPDGAERHVVQLLLEAQSFHAHFHQPNSTATTAAQHSDEMRPILSSLSAPMATDLEVQPDFLYYLFLSETYSIITITPTFPLPLKIILSKVLKILLRKEANRRSMGRMGLQLLTAALERQARTPTAAAAELGNVVINACYNGDSNVRTLIECSGLSPLLMLLRTRDVDTIQSMLGALQGICFVPFGRQHVRADFEVGYVELAQG